MIEKKSNFSNDVWSCFNWIDPMIYNAERLLQGFNEHHFDKRPELFERDAQAKIDFIYNYEYMQVQLLTISDLLFEIRLKCEFLSGRKDNPIIAARIRNEAEIQSWLQEPEPPKIEADKLESRINLLGEKERSLIVSYLEKLLEAQKDGAA
ncbi:hypothetical protein [Clostridium minihomine]|uniref:hypothetical protein n=1 Tax=Clostridium minihomine TaxID=2045012 RepID=UPI000C75BF18|nr:hypothetical protein [Clostridium minihomine]